MEGVALQRGADDLTAKFLAICGQVLEREVRDIDSMWYREGGDSLGDVEVLAVIEDRYGVELPEDLSSVT